MSNSTTIGLSNISEAQSNSDDSNQSEHVREFPADIGPYDLMREQEDYRAEDEIEYWRQRALQAENERNELQARVWDQDLQLWRMNEVSEITENSNKELNEQLEDLSKHVNELTISTRANSEGIAVEEFGEENSPKLKLVAIVRNEDGNYSEIQVTDFIKASKDLNKIQWSEIALTLRRTLEQSIKEEEAEVDNAEEQAIHFDMNMPNN